VIIANPDLTAFADLDELEAQLDATTPYYVPWLIAEIRRVHALRALLIRAHQTLAAQDDRDDTPRCPRCGSYAWIYQGAQQVCADCRR
jgi:hypothetical protein